MHHKLVGVRSVLPWYEVSQVVPCPGGRLYMIRPGDTYYSIALRTGTTVEALIRANPGVDPNALRVGQTICIPAGPVPVPRTPCPGGRLYTVRPGDTYYSIALRFGTTVPALIASNPGVDPNALRVGQVICISVRPTPIGPPACPGARPYVVRAGDTYFAIAARFGVSVPALVAANPGIDPNRLRVGQVICIPFRALP